MTRFAYVRLPCQDSQCGGANAGCYNAAQNKHYEPRRVLRPTEISQLCDNSALAKDHQIGQNYPGPISLSLFQLDDGPVIL